MLVPAQINASLVLPLGRLAPARSHGPPSACRLHALVRPQLCDSIVSSSPRNDAANQVQRLLRWVGFRAEPEVKVC